MAEADKSKQNRPECKLIWIINNGDSLRTLALKPSKQPGSNTLSAPEGILLNTGATVIDRAAWERWKEENPETERGPGSVKEMLEGKIPEDTHRVRRSERAGQPWLVEGPLCSDRRMPLADLSEAQARGLIPEIRDEKMLRDLLVVERRTPVAEAIRVEIDKFVRALRQPGAA